MNFFGLILPFIVSIGQQMSKIGSLGYDTVTKRLIYREAEGANGIKTLATTEDLAGLGGGAAVSPYFVGQIVQSCSPQVPIGFIQLNGGELSKITYEGLYAIFGDMHNDSNTPAGYFKLPDARSKFLLYDQNVLGMTFGSAFITESNLPKISPKLKVSTEYGTMSSPAFLAYTENFNGYYHESNTELTDIITPFGAEEPTAFYPPYLTVNMFVYSGVLF